MKVEEKISDIEKALAESKERLIELEKQDETGWSEFDKSIKGKEINMMLVKNHIKYYEDKLKKMKANSLSAFLKT